MLEQSIIERIDTWASSLFVTEFAAHASLKKELLTYAYQQKTLAKDAIASGVAHRAKHALYESDFNFLTANITSLQTLSDFFESAIEIAAYEMNEAYWPEDAQIKAHIVESWVHITQKEGYHDVHSHPNCSWCGIYYVDTPEGNIEASGGINRFYDPRNNAAQYLDVGNAYIHEEGVMDITPQEGKLVIFPSYLKHSALPYFGESHRIVIAFNAQVHFVE